MTTTKIITSLSLFLLLSCNQTNSEKNLPKIKPFPLPIYTITPPINHGIPTPILFKIDNSKDTILVSDKGSYISIPKNCFVDETGQSITKDITISLDEYLDPASILLSGIPMKFIEGRDTMDFQSAGMCKILASANSKPLQISKNKEINIGLRNLSSAPNYNLYYFDTLSGSWNEKEKNILPNTNINIPIPPLNIANVDSNNIVKITIENHKIRPLYKMWHKSKFYIYDKGNSLYADSSVWWYDMTIKPTQNKDLYSLMFNGVNEFSRQYTHKLIVQPLIDSVNFEAEMALFKSNMRLYISENEAQITRRKKELAQLKLDNIAYAKQFTIDSIAAVKQSIIDSLNQIKYEEIAQTRTEVMRSFTIKKMGIYNCDRFYIREIIATQNVGFIVENSTTIFDKSFIINTQDNTVLNSVPSSVNRYKISFDNQLYTFIGITGKNIYTTQIKLDEDFNPYKDYTVKKIDLSELEQALN